MDFGLTEEQVMIRDLCRQIGEEKIKPVREHHDETGEFPWDLVKTFADADLFGIAIEEEFGGMGGGTMDLVIAIAIRERKHGFRPYRRTSHDSGSVQTDR